MEQRGRSRRDSRFRGKLGLLIRINVSDSNSNIRLHADKIVSRRPAPYCRSQPGASATPPAFLSSENSPAIDGWVQVWPAAPVPQGRQVLAHGHYLRRATNYFFRPGRDFFFYAAATPAINGWAIAENLPRLTALGNFLFRVVREFRG